jgi:addiction module RelB/DinJ family antitoxin
MIMAQVSMTVRMDSGLKAAFDALCSEFGMSANTAMNVFAKAVVNNRKIPFEIKANSDFESMRENDAFKEIRKMAEAGKLPDLTPEEINEEIRLARKEKRRRYDS